MLATSVEEAEEFAFVLSARGEPAVRYWQFASVVVEEGVVARTVNLCQQCFYELRLQQGEPRRNSWQWRAVVEKKAHRGRIWRIMGNEQFTRGVWEYFFNLERAEAKRIQDDSAREKARRNTRPVAAGISIQGGPGAGQKK